MSGSASRITKAAGTIYSGSFTLSLGSVLTQRMLVFASGGDKTFDGTTLAALSGLKGNPADVTLVGGPGSTANFDNAAVGSNKVITYDGYSLSGADAGKYALAINCCGPVTARTTGTITPAGVAPTNGGTRVVNGIPLVNGVPVINGVPVVLPVTPNTAVPPQLVFDVPPVALTVVPPETPPVAVIEEASEKPVEQPVEQPVTVQPPVQTPPKPYVAPKRQPKQDRS